MTELDLIAIAEKAGPPGLLLAATIMLIHLYMRNEKARPLEPEWLIAVRAQFGAMAEQMGALARSMEKHSERAEERHGAIRDILTEIRVTLRMLGNNSDRSAGR